MEVAATKLRCGGIYLQSQGLGKSQEDCKFKANFSYIEGTGQRKRKTIKCHSTSLSVTIKKY